MQEPFALDPEALPVETFAPAAPADGSSLLLEMETGCVPDCQQQILFDSL